MKYKILEGIATADIAYEIYGKTLEELFTNTAEAVSQTMVDVTTVKPLLNSKCKIKNEKLENLLLDYLNQLLFQKDAKQILFSKFNIKINKQDAKPARNAFSIADAGGRYQLDANSWGEKIDPKKHKLKTDVKAVTRHHLEIKKENGKFVATIVLDI